ncbi:MAG TPA: ABC transporter ATP-binding protein [Solirubrobacteraceae bacterium]|nr:ABC transporter ATP-binding protein [Solirubrobacteraceae bacterium]
MSTPQPERSPDAGTMRGRMGILLGERRGLVGALVLSSIGSGFSEAATLAVIAQVAAALVNGSKQVHLQLGPTHLTAGIGTLIAVAFACTLLRLALQFPISILPARIAADVQSQLRGRLFASFVRASWAVQSRDREGQLQETMTSQVMQATLGALQATSLITSLFSFLVLMIAALALNVQAAAIVLAVSLALIALLRPLRSIGVRRARALSQAQVKYAGGVSEAIRLAEETQVFGVADQQRARIEALVADTRRLFLQTQLLARLIPNLFQSLIYVLFVVGLLGVYAAGSGRAGALGAVFLLLVRAAQYGQQSQSSYQALSQSLPFIERTQEAARRYEHSAPPTGRIPLRNVQSIRFERVGYAYQPGRPVLSEVSFSVARGEAIGIVGPSGAGKSTLVQILLRLRSPTSGRYLVDDVAAELLAEEDWHRLVAYVPQDPRLIHATVAENIRYYRDVDQHDVERAARLARIHDDVVGWPEGYQTVVGPRADAVSGGQQQRICLARALAAHPQVLILDEPTSALDPQSEQLIQESLAALRKELTLFVVAHRMSTLDVCDRAMVVLDGRLSAFDGISALRAANPYFRSASRLALGAASVGMEGSVPGR